jgi:hypothetical protein
VILVGAIGWEEHRAFSKSGDALVLDSGILPRIARRIVWICYLRVKATLRFAPALRGLDAEATDPRSLLGMAMRGRNGDALVTTRAFVR